MQKVGDKFICIHHLNALEDPVWFDCNHGVCRNCFLLQLKKKNTKCPVCDKETNYTLENFKNECSEISKNLIQYECSKSLEHQRPLENAKESIKITFVGYLDVGKTSLIRGISGYRHLPYQVTIGIDIIPYQFEVGNKIYNVSIWDTSGQERFQSVSQSYYRESHGTVFVYSVTDSKSYDSLSKWMKYVRDNSRDGINLIIGNKIDLIKERCIPEHKGKQFASQNNALFYETSAVSGENVKEAFQLLVRKIIKNLNFNKDDGRIHIEDTIVQNRNGCC